VSAGEMTAWLRAQVEADKAAARAAGDGRAGDYRWRELDPDSLPGLVGTDTGDVVTFNNGTAAYAVSPSPGQAAHVAVHDPRDVIADCDAKLDALDLCERVIRDDAEELGGCGAAASWTGLAVARLTVQMLASGYRHRDGWQEEWAA
jgi:hypothetical protein